MKPHTRKAAAADAGVPTWARGERQDAGWLRVSVRHATTVKPEDTSAPAKGPGSSAHGRVDRMTLSALLQAPERVSEVPVEQIPVLVAELASEQAALSAMQGVLTARLLVAPAEHPSGDAGDRLLTAEEVAGVLGVTKRWVQRRARRLPFSRRISVRSVRYSEAGLKRWMANRHAPKP